MSKRIKPEEVIDDAIEDYIYEPIDPQAIIDQAIAAIISNHRIRNLDHSIGAFRHVVRALIRQYPNKKFDEWLVTSDSDAGQKWWDAVKKLKNYWNKSNLTK
jgi:hypothetical protein